jgi:cysteine desulfurase / selenocysteine lyase
VAADCSSCPQIRQNPWEWFRSQMPVARKFAYFDHAAVAPLPEKTSARLQEWALQAAESGDVHWPEWSAEIEKTRLNIACWIGAGPDEIALVPNTTYGINIVAEGFPWKSGDNVVLLADDFPSNRLPWLQQAAAGVEIREVPAEGGAVSIDQIAMRIDSRTRIVALSSVGYATGFRLPLAEIVQLTHERGAYFFLDAIQSLGVFPLDVRQLPIDFMAADGHKWMLGPEGAGIAYIRREHLDRLRCRTVGWNSVVARYDFSSGDTRLRPEAARWEGGSANICGLLALGQSLNHFWEIEAVHGREALANRVLENAGRLRERLQSVGAEIKGDFPSENRSGIVVFNKPQTDPQEIRRACLAAGVVMNCRGGGVRASVHAYNNDDDIERLIRVLA